MCWDQLQEKSRDAVLPCLLNFLLRLQIVLALAVLCFDISGGLQRGIVILLLNSSGFLPEVLRKQLSFSVFQIVHPFLPSVNGYWALQAP